MIKTRTIKIETTRVRTFIRLLEYSVKRGDPLVLDDLEQTKMIAGELKKMLYVIRQTARHEDEVPIPDIEAPPNDATEVKKEKECIKGEK